MLLKKNTKHILLDQKDFEKLVSGDVVEKEEVKIILKDIGYKVMLEIILEKYNMLVKSLGKKGK